MEFVCRCDGAAEPGPAIVVIEDPADSRLAPFARLRDHDLRRRQESAGGAHAGYFVAEGDVVVERAIRAGYQVVSLLVDAERTVALPAGLPAGVTVLGAPLHVLEHVTGMGVNRGALALCARRPLPAPGAVIREGRRVLVLEAVVNPTNLGLIARSAAALGIDAMLLDPACSDPLYRRAARVAMGEVYALPYAVTAPLPEGLAPLHDAGFLVAGLTPDPDATPIEYLDAGDRPVALVLGAEGHGLAPTTLAACDHLVRIPMRAGVDSLNVGVAAAIACYVLARG